MPRSGGALGRGDMLGSGGALGSGSGLELGGSEMISELGPGVTSLHATLCVICAAISIKKEDFRKVENILG